MSVERPMFLDGALAGLRDRVRRGPHEPRQEDLIRAAAPSGSATARAEHGRAGRAGRTWLVRPARWVEWGETGLGSAVVRRTPLVVQREVGWYRVQRPVEDRLQF